MNRLILIGNGFDLSHGLKTSYKDFLTDYLWNCINQFYSSGSYNDLLIKVGYNSYGVKHGLKNIEKRYDVLVNEIKFINNNGSYTDSYFKYNSEFFQHLILKCNEVNWVDIEIIYFDYLKGFAKSQDKLTSLNEQFYYLQELLEKYLSGVDKGGSIRTRTEDYTALFTQKFKTSNFIGSQIRNNSLPSKLHILNFNYTSTFARYLVGCQSAIRTEVNHIHGELNNENNPLIFGFGDEYDKDYLEFENLKSNKLFPHIKSFGYFKTKNYHDLIRFTNQDDFQVFIVGHSCGLSDRTMLKHIFEHERCKSIKIFHYGGKQDFTEKTYDIARHFSNKGEMRLKIATFDPNDSVPQIIESKS